jgi:hypothetical protein
MHSRKIEICISGLTEYIPFIEPICDIVVHSTVKGVKKGLYNCFVVFEAEYWMKRNHEV